MAGKEHPLKIEEVEQASALEPAPRGSDEWIPTHSLLQLINKVIDKMELYSDLDSSLGGNC